MPNIFSGINLALRAMLSHQQMIEVIEHNVANANTPNYHRQEAVMAAGMPYPAPQLSSSGFPGQMGSGVLVDRVRRHSLDFYDGRYRRELAGARQWEAQRDALQQVEFTLAETAEDGLIPEMDAFWAGWQALGSDPANMALRADLRQRAENLAGALNQRARALLTLREDSDLAIQQNVDEINTLASQVARLNVEIANVQSVGDAPNDLLDLRDGLLDRLAELAGAEAHTQENGEVLVSIGRHALVIGAEAFELSTARDPANDNLTANTWSDDGRRFDPPRGVIASQLEVRDTVIPDQLNALNEVAFSLANRVNALHQTGYGLNNNTAGNPPGYDGNFFASFTTNDYALEIRLSANLDDLNNIAAAAAPNSPGDGGIANAIMGIQNELLMGGGTSTLRQFYSGKVNDLALEIATAEATARDRGLVLGSLMAFRESAVGVNLDEEAANLVKAQKVYNAAARMMTALDEMLDRVINGMGLVGR